VEFADTRKPITRATDGNATDRYTDVPGKLVEDTVDDSLARAEAMFREAAVRGNLSGRTPALSLRCLHAASLGGTLLGAAKPAGAAEFRWLTH